MLSAPLWIDVRPGAVARLGELLADNRISGGGHVALAVGPGLGERVAERVTPGMRNAELFTVPGCSLEVAVDLAKRVRSGSYDAVVGIGGGRTIDVAKYAASMAGLPMVAVATNLSHDGICSPVSSLEHDNGKGSFGVAMPLAVIVDLDYVRAAPVQMVRAGVGDVVSNLSAIDDWLLAAQEKGEPVDGMAVTFARTAAEALLYRQDSVSSDAFLTVLAESLVLSGMAMAAAGSSRPCSGGDHEILHAIDQLYPGTGNHGELAGVGALFCCFLRGDPARTAVVSACLARHGLPKLPSELGLSDDQFAAAVDLAPRTRPGRYTILEHLDLDAAAIRRRVDEYVRAFGS
ncbi:MAG: iron-containing alcohol dehydrogenase [Streptosporangiales bacterium]|nr:iron-containing alcohol dehydrogenase [Streptosporangiales bacterium]